MGLISELQSAALDPKAPLAPMLLKLRLLAARLGSKPLAEWVRHESEGYPKDVAVPDYRELTVVYRGTFAGPFGSGVNNVEIPAHLVRKFGGDSWLDYQVRSSISAIDELAAKKSDGGQLQITNAGNLGLLLRGNVFPDYEPISIIGLISHAELAAVQHAVRSKVLELTIELEQEFPDALKIGLDPDSGLKEQAASERVSSMSTKIIYGPNIEVTNTGNSGSISLTISAGNTGQLAASLVDQGIDEADANELAKIIASETPSSRKEPLGKKAQAWLVKNLKKAIDGTWKVGSTVATEVISKAALKYYGLE